MSRRALSARISADLELTRITITLSRFGPPRVELSGSVNSPNRRAAGASSFKIETAWTGPRAEAFIEEMRTAFSAAATTAGHKEHE